MKSRIIINVKKLISVLICTTLISSTLPYNLSNYVVFAEEDGAAAGASDPGPSDPDSQDEGIYVHDLDSLKNAINNAQNGDIITLASDIQIPNSTTALEENYRCILNCSKNITIKSAHGQRCTIYHRSPDGILAMIDGCTVNLENITIDFGRTNDSSNFDVDNTLIKLYGSNTLNLTLGTTLQNAYVKSGSPIYCTDSSNINIDQTSTLTNLHTPYSGTIYAENNSTITLNGTISNCSSTQYGGAIYSSNNCTLNVDGTISDCSAQGAGGAIYVYNNSTLTINGSGTISNCHTNEDGGAIFNDGGSTLQIYGGSISGCSSTNTSGKGNAIYNASTMYVPTLYTGLFSISVPADAMGTDNALAKYGYPGIYDKNISTPAQFLYRVQFDLNGGIDSSGNTSIDHVLVLSGESLGNMLPTNITKTISGVTLNLYKWVDGNNNEVTSSTPISNNTTLHARYCPPQIASPTITKAESGSSYNAGDWSNESITLSYPISSPDIPINPDKYKISLNGTDFNDASVYSSSNTIRINSMDSSNLKFTILQSGEYQIRIQAFDADGISATSDPISIKIDRNRPLHPTINDSQYSNVSTPTIRGTGEPECTVTATDEDGNIIGTSIVDSNREWKITTSPMQDGKHTMSVMQTDKAGNQSDPITKEIIVDTTAPNGSISIGSNIFYEFLNTITFGLLFTNTTTVIISTSDDSLSGIKTIEYLKTEEAYSTITEIIDANPDWQTGTISNNSISFNIDLPPEQLNDKFFIYARITDNAENRAHIRSDGIIIYTDALIDTDEISYTKLDQQDKNLSVNLNGNTIFSITNGNHTLVNNTDYSIADYRIILSHQYLNGLAAGDYELKINFAPAGETNLDPNLILPNSTAKLYVEKTSQQLPPENAKFNNLNSSYTHGDTPGTIYLNGGSGTGAVTYASTNPDVATINSTTGEITILKAGTFNIVATKAADENYEELIVTSNEIAVNRRSVTITGVTAENKVYDGTTNATPVTSSASIDGIVNGDDLSFFTGTATFTDKNVADRKTVSFAGFALTGNDAANYNLSAQPADATANISVKPLNILNIKIKDKVFDGTKTAEFDGNPALEGLVVGDNVILINGTPIFTNADIGSNILIEFSTPFSIRGANSSNYSITQPSSIYANIIAPESSDSSNTDNNIGSTNPEDAEPSEYEDTTTGIQVSAPEGVIQPRCKLVVDEIYPDTDEYNDVYNKLDNEKKAITEYCKLYEIHLEDQDGNIIQPNTSKELVTVRIPVPDNYDLNELEIYRINEDTDDSLDENVVNISNKNYCEYRVDHFSTYIMIDKNTTNDIIKSIFYYLIIFLPLLLIALFIILLKKRKNKEDQ